MECGINLPRYRSLGTATKCQQSCSPPVCAEADPGGGQRDQSQASGAKTRFAPPPFEKNKSLEKKVTISRPKEQTSRFICNPEGPHSPTGPSLELFSFHFVPYCFASFPFAIVGVFSFFLFVSATSSLSPPTPSPSSPCRGRSARRITWTRTRNRALPPKLNRPWILIHRLLTPARPPAALEH